MPAPILHLGASVLCTHGMGQATPAAPFPRVTVSGMPIAVLTTPYLIAACTNPPASGGPCVTAQWVLGAMRVMAGGQPVLLMTGGHSISAPTPAPLTPVASQTRAIAT